MPQHYARIAFTDQVKEAQQANGSRRAMQRFEEADFDNDILGPAEARFITERDGFYLATTNSNGWPYVQHRGGPRDSCTSSTRPHSPGPNCEETGSTSATATSPPTSGPLCSSWTTPAGNA